VGYSVIETSNKEFVVAGSTHPDTSDYYNTYLLKTDTLGNEIWSTQYPGPGEDWGHCVKETSDGGYIIAGWVSSGGGGDIRLIKTAPDILVIREDKICNHTSNIVIHPNPFSKNVNIEIDPSKGIGHTELMVYDIEGKLVKELCGDFLSSTSYVQMIWDGCDNSGRQLPPGVYFLRMGQGDFTAVKKLILLR
jgi:hypothetical protein